MRNIKYDLVVIGGGPAGMASALKANELGIDNILVIERNSYLGGILPQCIHNGFGLKIFKKDFTGPEYSQIFIDRIAKTNIHVMLGSTALSVSKNNDFAEIITASKINGINKITARSVILSLGCRERTRGQVSINGTRPSGIYTAGFIQKLANMEGYIPGKNVLILGSGDIGLIMARRLKLEGANVIGVLEIMPFSTGLTRNIYQCLKDYDIELFLSHTVSNIYGDKKIEAVEISQVDSDLRYINTSKSRKIKCDCLLLSVGLIPENEISKTCGIDIDKNTSGPAVNEFFHTKVDGVFACGNSLFVNDIVDNVTEDGYIAAEGAFNFLNGNPDVLYLRSKIDINCGNNVAYVAPHRISAKKDVVFKIRARTPMKDAVVEFDSINFAKKIKYVVPGELIQINVGKSIFDKLGIGLDKVSKININIRESANEKS